MLFIRSGHRWLVTANGACHDRSPVQEKNQLREVIKELFRERDCVTIVRPVADEAELRNIQSVDYEKLRPQFRTQVEARWGRLDDDE